MINPEMFSKHLYTRYYPDPDLLIRTSGEMRISNFLLWQLSYTEMYVTPKLWPDFTRKDLFAAVDDFAKRQRRYGGVWWCSLGRGPRQSVEAVYNDWW